MKKLLVPVLFFFGMSLCMAQSNVVVVSQNAEPFTLMLNGVAQNETPQTTVKLTGIEFGEYQLKVLFANKDIQSIDRGLYVDAENETTLVIKRNKEQQYALRLLSQIPLNAKESFPQY